MGRIDARAGAAAAHCIEHAVALARAGEVAGIVTAPRGFEVDRVVLIESVLGPDGPTYTTRAEAPLAVAT